MKEIIEIKEEVQVGNIILEVGDMVRVLDEKTGFEIEVIENYGYTPADQSVYKERSLEDAIDKAIMVFKDLNKQGLIKPKDVTLPTIDIVITDLSDSMYHYWVVKNSFYGDALRDKVIGYIVNPVTKEITTNL